MIEQHPTPLAQEASVRTLGAASPVGYAKLHFDTEPVTGEALKFRYFFHVSLQTLEGMVGTFDQSTHPCKKCEDLDIGDVLMAMTQAYMKPTPYTISEMAQRIRAYLTQVGHG